MTSLGVYVHRHTNLQASSLHGLGIFADADIPAMRVVGVIPHESALSINSSALWHVSQSTGHPDVSEKPTEEHRPPLMSPEERDLVCDALFQLPAAVLFERALGEQSRWAEYLRTLPDSTQALPVPLLFPARLVAHLFEGTSLEILTERLQQRLHKAFPAIRAFVQKRLKETRPDAPASFFESAEGSITENNLALAYAYMSSRGFGVGTEGEIGLVPLADAYNHTTCEEHVHIECDTPSSDEEDDSDEDEDSDDEADEHTYAQDIRDGNTPFKDAPQVNNCCSSEPCCVGDRDKGGQNDEGEEDYYDQKAAHEHVHRGEDNFKAEADDVGNGSTSHARCTDDSGDEDERPRKVPKLEAEGAASAKAPTVEISNNSALSPSADVSVSVGDLVVKTVRPIKLGEELFNTFGAKCNTLLCLNYGFTVDENETRTAFVHKSAVEEATVRGTSPTRKERERLLELIQEVVDMDLTDDFFLLDGRPAYGLLLLLYVRVIDDGRVRELGEDGDEMEIVERLANLPLDEVLAYGEGEAGVLGGLRRLLTRRREELMPGGRELRSAEQAGLAEGEMSVLLRQAAAVRQSQLEALKSTAEWVREKTGVCVLPEDKADGVGDGDGGEVVRVTKIANRPR